MKRNYVKKLMQKCILFYIFINTFGVILSHILYLETNYTEYVVLIKSN